MIGDVKRDVFVGESEMSHQTGGGVKHEKRDKHDAHRHGLFGL